MVKFHWIRCEVVGINYFKRSVNSILVHLIASVFGEHTGCNSYPRYERYSWNLSELALLGEAGAIFKEIWLLLA